MPPLVLYAPISAGSRNKAILNGRLLAATPDPSASVATLGPCEQNSLATASIFFAGTSHSFEYCSML